MGKLNEDIFEGVVEIVAAAMEETEVEISAKGGEQIADFFTAIYKRFVALDEGAEENAKAGSFEVFADAKGEYRFRLKAANGETVAVSEGYQKKASCLNGVESVRKNAPAAALKEL